MKYSPLFLFLWSYPMNILKKHQTNLISQINKLQDELNRVNFVLGETSKKNASSIFERKKSNSYYWTEKDTKMLFTLKAKKIRVKDIVKELDRSQSAINSKWSKIKHNAA
jgi:hypothetical protein